MIYGTNQHNRTMQFNWGMSYGALSAHFHYTILPWVWHTAHNQHISSMQSFLGYIIWRTISNYYIPSCNSTLDIIWCRISTIPLCEPPWHISYGAQSALLGYFYTIRTAKGVPYIHEDPIDNTIVTSHLSPDNYFRVFTFHNGVKISSIHCKLQFSESLFICDIFLLSDKERRHSNLFSQLKMSTASFDFFWYLLRYSLSCSDMSHP